ILRYNGKSGAFIDAFVPPGAGGLKRPHCLLFTAEFPVDDPPLAGKLGEIASERNYPNGTVLAYTFDKETLFEAEGVSRVRDISGNGRHGVIHGATWTPEGRMGAD